MSNQGGSGWRPGTKASEPWLDIDLLDTPPRGPRFTEVLSVDEAPPLAVDATVPSARVRQARPPPPVPQPQPEPPLPTRTLKSKRIWPDGLPLGELAYEWDGRAPWADLWVDRLRLEGSPEDVLRAFELLVTLRDRMAHREAQWERIRAAIYEEASALWQAVWR